ncbi:MAG: hypothetical protein COA38_18610 [Fluviicola sp.]|nr:MAG: hypothetical protein COA38_18610 [Fluviicola sp.]
MKLDIFQKIGVGLGAALILYILFFTLLKDRASQENLEYISGQIESFERFKLKKKWSVSYNIGLTNNSHKFKIIPEYYDCVKFNEIELKKLVGKHVMLGIDSDKGLTSNYLESVVSLKYNNQEYINLNCVNAKIDSDKKQIPLIIIGGAILIAMVIWGNKRLKKK